MLATKALKPTAKLLVIIQEEQLLDTVTTGEAKLIFKETPFYAEMGGQVADTGTVVDQSGVIVAEITDVKSTKWPVLHTAKVTGNLTEGASYFLQVDQHRRNKIIKTTQPLIYCTKR